MHYQWAIYRLSALRQKFGFQTVSQEVVVVFAGAMPIDIAADEMRRIQDRRRNTDRS